MSQVYITPYRVGDDAFIYGSWKESYRSAKQNLDLVDWLYYANQTRVIDKILDRDPSPLILVARKKFILGGNSVEKSVGWIVGEDTPDMTVVHYCYVKRSHRRAKVGLRLLCECLTYLNQDSPRYFTHKNHNAWLANRLGFSYLPLTSLIPNAPQSPQRAKETLQRSR